MFALRRCVLPCHTRRMVCVGCLHDRVYTDASVMKNSSGIGIWCEKRGMCKSLGLKGRVDVNRAELAAVFVALAVLDYKGDVTVCTDSVTSLMLIEGTLRKERYRLLTECINYMVENWDGEVRFELVKGHSGNKGNDKADNLARNAAKSSIKYIDLPDDITSTEVIAYIVLKYRFLLSKAPNCS